MNIHVPNCRICNQPLTDNELDTEPGGEPSYFSAHSGCTSQTANGRFVVVSYLNGNQLRTIEGAAGYQHEARAIEIARGLGLANSHRSEFRVWDRSAKSFTFRVRGSFDLRDVYP